MAELPQTVKQYLLDQGYPSDERIAKIYYHTVAATIHSRERTESGWPTRLFSVVDSVLVMPFCQNS